MNFWKDGFSIDESRVSILILLTVISVIFGLIMYYFYGDITSNFVTLAQTLILAVAGVNGVKSISDAISKVKKNDDKDDYSESI